MRDMKKIVRAVKSALGIGGPTYRPWSHYHEI